MAQILDTSTNPAIVRSDITLPSDMEGSHTEETILVVDDFQEDIITFVLDERFREQVHPTLQGLLLRSSNIVFDPLNLVTQRDPAESIIVDLGDPSVTSYASVVMRSPTYRGQQIPEIVNTEFRELV